MLHRLIICWLIALLVYAMFACGSRKGPYTDGVYKGSSQAEYTAEPYWGNVTITIRNGYITDVAFQVVDSSLNEVFSENYERHFADNPIYMEQCRNDWKGIQNYPNELIAKQEMDSVDVVTGATWSYNILNAAVKDALKDALKK